MARKTKTSLLAAGFAIEQPDVRTAVQIPLWTEKVRGLPNSFARSALFCVGSKATRRNLHNQPIAAMRDTVIRYTGMELRQDDEDVFLQLVHLARGRPSSELVEFSAYGMLKELGWGDSAKAYTRLRECLERLKANALKIEFNVAGRPVGFMGSLIRKTTWNDHAGDRQTWKVWFEKEVVVLFGATRYSEIEWSQRTRLKGEVSKWLLGFYFSMSQAQPMRIEELRTLCGSQCNSLTSFRQTLKKAYEELKGVGFLHDYKVEREWAYVAKEAGDPINRVRSAGLLEATLVQEHLQEGLAMD